MNSSAGTGGEAPAAVVTVTSTNPAGPAGLVAVICVPDTTLNDDAAALPKLTAVAPVKPVPVIVTSAPPAVLPLAGEIPVTVGRGTL